MTSYTIERLNDTFDLLQAIKGQTCSDFEIIFVVERSRELFEKVRSLSQEIGLSNLKLIFSSDKLGISEARNVGVRSANGGILAFTDDDAVPFPNWAEEVAKTFDKHKDVIGITGPVLPLWENETLNWFPEEFYWMIGCSAWKDLNNLGNSDYAWGANMAFRKEAFEATLFKNLYANGAHAEGKLGPVGDDVDFSYSLKKNTGKEILFNPEMKVSHKVNKYKLSSKFIRRYSYWQGYSDSMFKDISGIAKERSKTEFGLFSRIVSKLLPSIIKGCLRNSSISLKKAEVSAKVIFYFGLGYISYRSPILGRVTKNFI